MQMTFSFHYSFGLFFLCSLGGLNINFNLDCVFSSGKVLLVCYFGHGFPLESELQFPHLEMTESKNIQTDSSYSSSCFITTFFFCLSFFRPSYILSSKGKPSRYMIEWKIINPGRNQAQLKRRRTENLCKPEKAN